MAYFLCTDPATVFLALPYASADTTGLPLPLFLFSFGRAQVLYHNTLEEMSILGDGLVRITGAGRGEKLLQFFRKVRAGPLFFLRGSLKKSGEMCTDNSRKNSQEQLGFLKHVESGYETA